MAAQRLSPPHLSRALVRFLSRLLADLLLPLGFVHGCFGGAGGGLRRLLCLLHRRVGLRDSALGSVGDAFQRRLCRLERGDERGGVIVRALDFAVRSLGLLELCCGGHGGVLRVWGFTV